MFIVAFHGGFANQLFQYTLYLKLCEDFSTRKVFADIRHYKTCKDHGGFKLDKFVKLNYRKIKKNEKFICITENNYYTERIDADKNYLFDGYWH